MRWQSVWRESLPETIGEWLALSLKLFVVLNAAILGLFSVWVSYQVVVHLAGWLGRTIFSEPW